jgi:hypothetical protein
VIKHVINDNGGTKVASDFTMNVTATNPSDDSFPGAESPGTTISLDAGSYSVDEGAVSGYTKSLGTDCSGTIALGESKTCTITNDDQAASLTVIKHVINDNGGTKVAADFTMNVTASNPSDASFPGAESPGTTITVDAGAYSVDEGAVSGYTKSLGAGCSGTLAPGGSATCTITNDDQPASLTVIKHVINDNGGTKVAADFTMNVTATNPSDDSFPGEESPGTTISLDAGSYSVDEGAVSGYTKSIGANCSGTLAPGGSATCTITNDDIPPPVVSQITPTATTCQQFASDNAATLTQLQYSLKGNPPVVNQVNPGVFFYWVEVTAVAGSNTFHISQTIQEPTNFDNNFFAFASGSNVFNSNCTAVSGVSITQSSSTGAVTITFNAGAGGTFFIGVKYDAGSVKNKPAPNPTTVHYDFATAEIAGSTEGLDLVKK